MFEKGSRVKLNLYSYVQAQQGLPATVLESASEMSRILFDGHTFSHWFMNESLDLISDKSTDGIAVIRE